MAIGVHQQNVQLQHAMKKLFIIALLIICSYVSNARAEISPEKRKEVEKMLRLTGMEKLVTQMEHQMISAFQKQIPDVPEDFWSRFEKKLDVRELIEKIIPIYDKYYTLEDLKAVNAFYESPAGQKILSTLPQVMQEAVKIGQEWGEQIGKQAAAEAEEESKKK
jgi:hypothetical protein